MEQKIRTGQRVQLAKHDSRVLRGAVGIICDNDSDARFPLVKWMDRSMIASEVRLRGNSPQARTISLAEVCALHGCGLDIPKSKMGAIIKDLKAMYPAADGKEIADLVKANLCD